MLINKSIMIVETIIPEEFLWPVSTDQDLICRAINSVYGQVGLPEPEVSWFDSIYAAEFAFQILITGQMENLLLSDLLENASDPQYQFMIDEGSFFNLPNNWEHTKFPKRAIYKWLDEKGADIKIVSRRIMEFIQNAITGGEGVILDEKRWMKDSVLPLMHNSGGLHCMPKPLMADNIFEINPLTEKFNLINQSCFCCYLFDQLVILVRFPQKLLVNNQGYLHCDDGPATIWHDGACSWHLNGIFVPRWVVENPTEDIDTWDIISVDNGVRREIIKKIGLEKFTNLFGAVTVDKVQYYELVTLEVTTQDIYTAEEIEFLTQQKYLKMRNPSTGEVHIEGVHPDCQTVKEALAWRNSTQDKPIFLT